MVKKLCEDHAPLTALRAVEGTEPGFCKDFWQQLSALAIPGLIIDEQHGGLGLGSIEAAIVAEQLGSMLVNSPYLGSSILASTFLQNCADSAITGDYLRALASGEQTIAVAFPEPGAGSHKHSVTTHAQRQGDGWVLSGTKHLIPYAAAADALIVFARDDNEQLLAFLIDADALKGSNNATLSYQDNLAKDALYKLTLTAHEVPQHALLHDGNCTWAIWCDAMHQTLTMVAAYAVGAAQQVHDIAIDYAKYRQAFGRPIGGFQAIAHYLADVTVAIEGSRTLVYQAAWAKDDGRAVARLAAMAKLQACDTFFKAASTAIQVHGGIGYTTEADPQLFFRRARQLQNLYWDSDYLEQVIADTVFTRQQAHV
jgi:alkylation response protein AidB-like acyl-CoA dehydrogenase